MTGFFHDEQADPQAWKFGAITRTPIQPDRDWRPWRGDIEIQNKNGFDPLSCSSYGTLNAIETYLNRVFGVKKNYSDRWLATKTGTKEKGGNDPHYVFEYIRKNGVVEEGLWPFTTQQTYDEYYSGNPALDEIAADFNKDFKLEHESIYGGSAEIWEALQYCPVPLSVNWNRTESGYWWKEGAIPDNHWVVADYGKDTDFIGIFDSGEPSDKKASWSRLRPQLAKSFTITRRDLVQELTRQRDILTWIRDWWIWFTTRGAVNTPPEAQKGPATPPNPPTPSPTPTKATVTNFCLAIQEHEGWFPGSRSWKNNNPGNLRSWPTQTGSAGGFAVFPSYDHGFAALKTLVRNAIANKGSYAKVKTIHDFFSVYAPSSDGNNVNAYAAAVAKRLGVLTSFEIKKLV